MHGDKTLLFIIEIYKLMLLMTLLIVITVAFQLTLLLAFSDEANAVAKTNACIYQSVKSNTISLVRIYHVE